MFYDRFLELCQAKGVKPTNACVEAGLSRGLAAKWKATGTEKPSADALEKMAVYFKMSIEEILGKEKTPVLTEKDKRDVARDVERFMGDLENSGDLMFDGVPMSEEAKAAMAAAMRIGLEEAKRRNKATYTPKKYRKG